MEPFMNKHSTLTMPIGLSTHLRFAIASHDQCKCGQVKQRKYNLTDQNVLSLSRESVEDSIDVHVKSRIDQWSSVALDVVVVSLAFQVCLYLLHICYPINFSICLS